MPITNYPEYPQEQIEFLRKFRPTHSMVETVEAINKHFNLNLTKSSVQHRCNKFGIKGNYDGRFRKDEKSWNSGINIKTDRPDIYARYLKSAGFRFKKGRIPKNTKPVGSEKRYRGVTVLKIAMPNVWVIKSRYVYEKAHNVELTKKDKILHLDGDCYNDNLENLIKVNDGVLARLNKLGFKTDNKELMKSVVYQQMLLQKIYELEKE